MNIVQQSVRYVSSGWLSANTGLSSRGSIYPSEQSKGSLISWSGQGSLAPSLQPHPGRSTLPRGRELPLPRSRVAFQGTQREPSLHQFAILVGSFVAIIYNSGGNTFRYIHCHCYWIHENFQGMGTFQTRKGLTFSLLARVTSMAGHYVFLCSR